MVSPSESPAPELVATLAQEGESREQARALSEAVELPPANLPGYRILRRIGEGKFGSVWLAREQNTGKQVAIKFYATRRGVDWALLAREVEKLAALYTSRNIVGLVTVGWDHDPPYYIMEYLEKGSVATRLSQGPMPVTEANRLITGIARGLLHAHARGVLHCDLKPANILLDNDDEPRLCDFGQSRLVDEQTHALGTLFYMAPEQADLRAVPDAAWDIYALGAIWYHLLTGSPPYYTAEANRQLRIAKTLEERLATYRHIVYASPKPSAHRAVSGVDGALADLIDRCLAVNPHRRVSSAQGVLDQLASRDRQRARRPLLLLGLLLPIVLLVSMAPLALQAIHVADSIASTRLTHRALESDAVSANLLAISLEREILDRFNELQRITEYPRVQRSVAEFGKRKREDRGPLNELLSDLKKEVDDRHRAEGRILDNSWFLQDASGMQIWREPESMQSIDENYAHRDYFHGRNEEFDPGKLPPEIGPTTKSHLSMVYSSTTTGRFKVALTMPIFDFNEPSKVIGVLGSSLYIGELLKDYEKMLGDYYGSEISRVIALVDSRDWKLIAHPWMDDEHLGKLSLAQFLELRLDNATAKDLSHVMIQTQHPQKDVVTDRMENYIDPVSRFEPDRYGGEWLAAFSEIHHSTWIAVVQERRRDVQQPVRDMRQKMLTYAWWALGVAGGLVAMTWLLLVYALRQRSMRRSSRPRNLGAATERLTAVESQA